MVILRSPRSGIVSSKARMDSEGTLIQVNPNTLSDRMFSNRRYRQPKNYTKSMKKFKHGCDSSIRFSGLRASGTREAPISDNHP